MVMHLGLFTVLACAVITVSSVCIEDDKYVKSLDTRGRHVRAKDVKSDVELIDSGLKAKLDHGLDQTELLEKKWDIEKSVSHLGKDVDEKFMADGNKYKDIVPLDEELLSKIKHGIDISELTDEEIKSVVIYLKQLGAGKDDIEEFFFQRKDDEDYEEKAYMDKSFPLKKLDKASEMDKKQEMHFKEHFGDKASEDDKKTYLAESMAHMKMAADLKEYPNLKVEGFVKKIEDDKKSPHLKSFDEEEFLKKGLDSVKLEDLYAYFKKAEAEKEAAHAEKSVDKSIGKEFHPIMKDIHAEEEFGAEKATDLKKVFKFEKDEEKLIDEWKAGHKDLFKKEDEKVYGLDKEMKLSEIFKGKSAHELDKIFKDEDVHYSGGSHAYEQAREKAIKDAKVLLNDDTLKVRKHADGSFEFGGDKKIYDSKDLYTGKGFEEKGHEASHKIAAEAEKALHEEEMKAKGMHGLEAHKAGEKHNDVDKKISFGDGKEIIDEKFLSEDVLKALKEMYGSKLHFGTEAKKDEEIFDIDGKLAFEAGKGIYGEKVHLSEDAIKTKDLHEPKITFEDDFKKIKLNDGKVAHDSEKAVFGEKTHYGEEGMKSKAHVIGSGIGHEKGKIYTEEIGKKIHSIGSSILHDEDLADEDIYKEKIHGLEVSEDKVFHDHFAKEHGIVSEKDHVLHGIASSDKDVHYVTDVEKIDKGIEEKKKKKVQETGNRFMQFLKNVFGFRKCHLVTMRPQELLGIIDCISKSKDPVLCEKFAMCEKKMPSRVIAAHEKCQKELILGEMKKCSKLAPLYPSMEIPVKIFQCTARSVKELHSEEKEEMIAFEECARKVKKEGCSRGRWIRSHD